MPHTPKVVEIVDVRTQRFGRATVKILSFDDGEFDAEVRCAVKDRSDTTCHACPISMAHERESALGPVLVFVVADARALQERPQRAGIGTQLLGERFHVHRRRRVPKARQTPH
mgnify:CR=1 FL=1